MSTYTDAGAEHPEPPHTGEMTSVRTTDQAEGVDDAATELAVRHLVEPWTSASTGRAEVVCVEGTHLDALGKLGVRSARLVEIDAGEALAWIAWSGASGGAHGRRRGMAHGRFAMWWLLGALGDLHDEWPPANHEIESLLDDLRWYRWDAHEPPGGWRLQLAIEDEQRATGLGDQRIRRRVTKSAGWAMGYRRRDEDCARRSRGIRHQAPRRVALDRRRRGGLVGRARARQDQGCRGAVRHRPRHDRPRREPRRRRARRRDPLHANPDACLAGAAMPRCRQARTGRDPAVRRTR